ncbi:ankyrin-3-like isoform X2 [Saccostrea echinata]|uniref:ankyrin-3-like isoform X2 n=1 Tax=Saccostrea echinata TaxID=191078 RepID=UPI002A7F847F|nr:ankyrin-3-like isoform X2 [Saccostrea echinata]
MASEDYYCKYCALESQGLDDPFTYQIDSEKKNYREIFPELLHQDFYSKSEYICSKHRHGSVHHLGFVQKAGKSGSVNVSNFKYNIANPVAREEKKKVDERTLHKHGEVIPKPGTCKAPSPVMDVGNTKSQGALVKSSSNNGLGRASPSHRQCCCCSEYHHHTFESPEFYIPRDDTCSKLEETLSKNHGEVILANETFLNISNAFWYPSLCLNQFSSEFIYTNFESLWPEENVLRDILRDSIQNTVLRSAIPQLTKVAIVCGPVDMLKSLISLSLVRLDTSIEEEAGLLHYACLFKRLDIISYLTSIGIHPKLKDKHGNFADALCFSSKIYKHLPNKYQLSHVMCPSPKLPSAQDRNVIFTLARSPRSLYEIQRMLQMFEFNVNTECDETGNFLIHLVTETGLCQLPLIYSLRHIQYADIELCNSEGLTPLMIAAVEGANILCDVLICVFGADPNKSNVHNGRTALHYATQYNHVSVVGTLIKRGADFNKDDYQGLRPDDLNISVYHHDDCLDIITSHRAQRIKHLSDVIQSGMLKKTDLWESDTNVTDENNFTLLMVAAIFNRLENVKTILEVSTNSINAQYYQLSEDPDSVYITGMTALSMAAMRGNADVIQLLLSKGANPVIADIKQLFPLHHAVLNNQEEAVKTILEFFPTSYWDLFEAMKMSKKTHIHSIIKQAWQRRQEEIVNPGLFESCMSGKAEQLYCLLEEGDNVDPKSGVGNWPLFLAVENGHLEIVRLLCQKGADIRKRYTPNGSTLLHTAALMGRVEVIDYLLELCRPLKKSSEEYKFGYFHRGLDINAVNKENKTALQVAAEKGYLKIVKSLLLHGATTSLLDASGTLFCLSEFGGVWQEISDHRQRHSNHIFNFITQDTKKNFAALMKIWLPGFDHNLRDKAGNTPLMVACQVGIQEIIAFLLQSAVYPQSLMFEDDDAISTYDDNDSGVQDTVSPTANKKPYASYTDDDLLRSFEFSRDYGNETFAHRLDHDLSSSRLETLLNDVEKPKGLSIIHDGLVSHVCAVNPNNGCTALHLTLEKGDNSKIVSLLLEADSCCVNIQDNKGLSPLHYACKLKRKKCVEVLLSVDEIDVNLLSLNGGLAEDMTTDKSIIKLIHHHRKGQPVRQRMEPRGIAPSSVSDFCLRSTPSTQMASTVNFEKIQGRFEALKRQKKD